MIRHGLAGVLVILAAPLVLHGAKESPAQADHDPAAALVRQLGDRSFQLREEAMRRLLQIGPPAKPALLAGLKAGDLEIRSRCERILEVVLEQDFKARLDAFVADKDGTKEHDLPGWKRWRRTIGEDPGARELYVEAARAQRRILEDADSSPKATGEKFAGEVQSLFQRLYLPNVAERRQLTLGDVAAMLFVSSDPDIPLTDLARTQVANLLHQPVFNNALRTGPRTQQVRKLFGAWAAQVKGQAANQVLNMAMQQNLKEGLDLALRLIQEQDFVNGLAIVAVGKLGSKEQLPVLDRLLTDKTVILNVNFNNKPGTAEVRDVALAMMVHLTGQSIKDYGYEFFRGTSNEQVFFAPAYLAFADAAKREAAFKKWHDWSAQQPKP